MRTLTLTCAGLGLLAAAAHSQGSRPFPADVAQFDTNAPEVVLMPRVGDFADLQGAGALTFQDLLLPTGEEVDLDVAPIDLDRLKIGFQVDGQRRPDLLDGLDLSVWHGTVSGDPHSEVYLSFSTAGSRGWVKTGGILWHMLAAPAGDNDWTASTIRIVSEEQLLEDGRELKEYCQAERLAGGFEPDVIPPTPPAPSGAADPCSLKECPVAMECDWQLFQVWNDLSAQTAYLTSLLGWVSCRYEEQADTILTFPYFQIWTTSNDPWFQQDQGGDCIDVLYELQGAWAFNIPGNAAIGHMLSGANLGCGVAWLDVLCNNEFGFSVSGNMDGGVQFPVQQQSGNWDFMVVAHELGHNFGALHTHDYGIDNCAGGQCITNGTIMSYCHLCPGGTANITTYFYDPTVTDVLKNGAQNCLADYDASPQTYCTALVNSLGCTPQIAYAGTPTLSGSDDFHVTASMFVGNKPGLFFYGLSGAANLPFFGGTLCVNPPLQRTAPQLGGGIATSCSGTYDYFFTQATMTAAGLNAGDQVHGQYWARDTNAAQMVGLSDGLDFLICQ